MPAATSAFWTEIVIADRCAAERDQDVRLGVARALNRLIQRCHRIDGDAKIDRDAAARGDDACDREIVRGDDLRRAKRAAGRDQLARQLQGSPPGRAGAL